MNTKHNRPSGLTYKTKGSKKTNTFSIKISDEDLEKLNKYAKLVDKKPATCARDLITNALNLIPLD